MLACDETVYQCNCLSGWCVRVPDSMELTRVGSIGITRTAYEPRHIRLSSLGFRGY
jgi:hypothetical protein